jgi:hypothetical protein
MRCRLRHAPSVARRTEGPAFSTESDNTVFATGITVNPDKASLQNAAFKKIPQVIFNELRHDTPALLLVRQK